jgi:ribosomal protein L36
VKKKKKKLSRVGLTISAGTKVSKEKVYELKRGPCSSRSESLSMEFSDLHYGVTYVCSRRGEALGVCTAHSHPSGQCCAWIGGSDLFEIRGRNGGLGASLGTKADLKKSCQDCKKSGVRRNGKADFICKVNGKHYCAMHAHDFEKQCCTFIDVFKDTFSGKTELSLDHEDMDSDELLCEKKRCKGKNPDWFCDKADKWYCSGCQHGNTKEGSECCRYHGEDADESGKPPKVVKFATID